MTIRSALDQELSWLDNEILKMGSLCEEAVGDAMTALSERNATLATKVIVGDAQINEIQVAVESRSYRVLATQQPAAGDLRHIITVMYLASELERMGDHAKGVAQLVLRIVDEPEIDELHQLPKMTNRVQKMIRRSLQAYITRDVDLAYQAIRGDEKVDRQYGKFLTIIFETMKDLESGVEVITPTYLLWMAHHLERIGDRVTNICERVIFMVTGEYVEMDED